jgi:hypothetical protein
MSSPPKLFARLHEEFRRRYYSYETDRPQLRLTDRRLDVLGMSDRPSPLPSPTIF